MPAAPAKTPSEPVIQAPVSNSPRPARATRTNSHQRCLRQRRTSGTFIIDTGATYTSISQEMAVLRPSLLTGLLATVSYNQARGARSLRLFELGHVYARGGHGTEPVAGYLEHASLGLVMAGPAVAEGWDEPERPADFFDLKGALLHALGVLDLPAVTETVSGTGGDVLSEHIALEVDGDLTPDPRGSTRLEPGCTLLAIGTGEQLGGVGRSGLVFFLFAEEPAKRNLLRNVEFRNRSRVGR